MLQLRTAGYKALDNLRSRNLFPPRWKNTQELEEATDRLMQQFLAERFAVSTELGAGFLMGELLDRAVRTDEAEVMDGEGLPEAEKLELVEALDRQNDAMGLYSLYASLLFPLVRDIAGRTRRTPRLLELASGSGGLALALASEAERDGIAVSVTGSDIVPVYMEESNRRAAEKKLPVTFRTLNAFTMEAPDEEPYDIVLISQSLHHFTPGQLAVIIAKAEERKASAFVGIDGYRDLLLGLGMPLVASLQQIKAFARDSLTSARKFYSEPELDLIAESAAGAGRHAVSCSWPVSVLSVRFDGGKPICGVRPQ
ncbi:MAG: methyltransferase domain-containing protein [Chlorobium sp.]|uniref:methyltransferase domain-containing protein n=1 Tax=Chlorobium sp. TaxID=1095 RepID=UPI0025BFE9F9|nr:methyltransferase domain-containing protein [Chlorobium sp.]MCF8383052.1 methyltransferase domain-containing protein [Chlorobium sp.]